MTKRNEYRVVYDNNENEYPYCLEKYNEIDNIWFYIDRYKTKEEAIKKMDNILLYWEYSPPNINDRFKEKIINLKEDIIIQIIFFSGILFGFFIATIFYLLK